MNKIEPVTGRLGIVLYSAVLMALTGCISSHEGPPTVYVPPPHVEASVSVALPGVEIRAESDFYEPLTPYGRWEVVGSYGRCWIPSGIEADWRPYSDGYWQRTDAGWYWASSEPWAWATYHYGRWDFSGRFGWYWVPQTQWAPAWVSWHHGGGYIGWAPLYPTARFEGGGALHVNVAVISPRAYVFVEEGHFLAPVRRSTVVVNNTTIINRTVNITNVKVVNNTVINEGPTTTVIERASGRRVEAVPVRDLRRSGEAAVSGRQRTPVSASEQRVPTPAPRQAQPDGRNAVTVRESPQAQKPPIAPRESPQAQKAPIVQRESPKALKPPIAPRESPQAQKPPIAPRESPKAALRNDRPQSVPRKSILAPTASKPAAMPAVKPQSRTAGRYPASINEPATKKADKEAGKTAKPTKAPNKKAPQPAREKPDASEKGKSKTSN